MHSSDASYGTKQTIVDDAIWDYMDNTSKLQGFNYSNWNFRDELTSNIDLEGLKCILAYIKLSNLCIISSFIITVCVR